MTLGELRRLLASREFNMLSDHARVFITLPDDEFQPMLVTYDAQNMIFRFCKETADVGVTERVLEDYSPDSGRNGVGS